MHVYFFYDKDKAMFLGSFTNQNNLINNQFGTQFINGNTVVIEYYEPNNVEFENKGIGLSIFLLLIIIRLQIRLLEMS